ncbi:MAG TPA: hypothetical protein VGO00_14015 [Kofleriaceae bacterium]|nr:hypothetical protein [Kofleriaceae bacterium]
MARWLLVLSCTVACKGNAAPEIAPGDLARVDDKLDGELDEPGWNHAALRGIFKDATGAIARPYSEIRLLRDDTHLVVGLYAADEDIRSTDKFELVAGELATTIAVTGAASDPRVAAKVDTDGTIDHPADDDEEWVVEATLPLAALGPSPIAITASRCDTVKSGERRCGSFRTTISPR